jgi:hypothetical protein
MILRIRLNYLGRLASLELVELSRDERQEEIPALGLVQPG